MAGAATPIGMMGYSGGGLASGWAAELQGSYAPELNIKGVASGGTPADLSLSVDIADGGPASGLGLEAAIGISREYPEIVPLFNDAGRALIADMADMCAGEAALRYPFRRFNEFTTVADPVRDPTVVSVLEQNKMGKAAPKAPVYLYHSVFDELVPFDAARNVHAAWCSKGAKVQLHADYLSEHVILAATGAPAAILYLDNRFAGRPAPNNC